MLRFSKEISLIAICNFLIINSCKIWNLHDIRRFFQLDHCNSILRFFHDVKAKHSDTVIGTSYYEDFFANKGNNNFNVPFKNVSYISRIKIKEEFSYIESNEPLNQQEIDLLNYIAKTFEEAFITQEEKLKNWLKEYEGK